MDCQRSGCMPAGDGQTKGENYMLQKNRRRIPGKKYFVGCLAAACAVTMLWGQSFVSRADFTGTVSVDYATIREKTDTSSKALGSIAKGKTINIKEEEQDASGTLWYQVYVDSNTLGYIRADLVNKGDGGEVQQLSADTGAQSDGGQNDGGQDNAQNGAASGASVQAETAMDAQYATTTPEVTKVRSGPSTSESTVDRLASGSQVVVSGQSNGNDGKTWYYVTFTGTNDVEHTGFVRSDLVKLGDMVPVPEEPAEPVEAPVEPEPEPQPVNKDYEVCYDQEEDGTFAWYLHDNVAGYKQKLQPLLDVMHSQGEEETADAKVLVRQRIAIVALIFLSLALIVAVIVMALKLRDVYYEDYEDEEDEEPEEDVSVRRRQRSSEEPEASSGRRQRAEAEQVSGRRQRSENEVSSGRRQRGEAEELSARRSRRQEEMEEPARRRRLPEEDDSLLAERGTRRRTARDERRVAPREAGYRDENSGRDAAGTTPRRKAKNFLMDDDEFEFEFLNMDDKGV